MREADLLAPGGPFEMRVETVLGERMRVFKNRPPNLRTWLADSAQRGDADYLVFDAPDARRLSYREHLARVASVARALQERYGVQKGDRVGILAANCPEWILAFWASMSLGALPVGMNGWWAGDEIRFALSDCQPKVLIADRKRLARLDGADPGMPVITVEEDFRALEEHDLTAALPNVPLDEDDATAILYTSGTSGRSKGVVHTHRNVIALVMLQLFHGARMMRVATPLPADVQRCSLVSNPLFHVSGLYTQVVTSLVTGAKTVWTRGRFDPQRVLELIQQERVTSWSPHGSMGPRVVHHPDVAKYDLSSVLNLGSGGAPVPRPLQEALRATFPNASSTLTVGYGLTEGTALACIAFGADLAAHPDSVGRPMPTVELEIRAAGEIYLRGPLIMKEYWNRPDETAASIKAGRWLRTGDIGRIADDRLYVESRKRDLILRGAENVSPVEIERRLEAHPAVREAAVVGVPHPELGQEVMAFVVPNGDAPLTADALTAWVAQALAYFKVPSKWELRDTPLPRNASGKLLRRVLTDGGDSGFIED